MNTDCLPIFNNNTCMGLIFISNTSVEITNQWKQINKPFNISYANIKFLNSRDQNNPFLVNVYNNPDNERVFNEAFICMIGETFYIKSKKDNFFMEDAAHIKSPETCCCFDFEFSDPNFQGLQANQWTAININKLIDFNDKIKYFIYKKKYLLFISVINLLDTCSFKTAITPVFSYYDGCNLYLNPKYSVSKTYNSFIIETI